MSYIPSEFTTAAVINANTLFQNYDDEIQQLMADTGTYLEAEMAKVYTETGNVVTSGIGINRVENIASLKLQDGLIFNTIEVLGYYTKGDGGGGTFYWDSTSTESDNGGTIIQATGLTTGRWKRVYSGPVNVKWFGAKGDGVTDDTDAINACFESARLLGFDIDITAQFKISDDLYLERGISLISTSVNKGGFYSDVFKTLFVTGAFTYNTGSVYNSDKSTFEYKNLLFSGVGISFGDSSLALVQGSTTYSDYPSGYGSKITGCEFQNCTFGVKYEWNCWQTIIADSHFHHNTVGVHYNFNAGRNSGGTCIISNTKLTDSANGVKITGSTLSGDGAHLYFTDTDFIANTDFGILIESGTLNAGSLSIRGTQDENNVGGYIKILAGSAWAVSIDDIWSFGAATSTMADIAGGTVYVKNISNSMPKKICKIVSPASMTVPDEWFKLIEADYRTGGTTFVDSSVSEYPTPTSSVVTITKEHNISLSANKTLLTLGAKDSSYRHISGSFHSYPSGATFSDMIFIFNPGGGNSITVPLSGSNSARFFHFDIKVKASSANKLYVQFELRAYDDAGTEVKSKALVYALTDTYNSNSYVELIHSTSNVISQLTYTSSYIK